MNNRLRLTATADIRAAQGESKPRFSTMAYAGGAITPDYYYAPLPVVMELSGLKANAPIAVLLDHSQREIVGQSTTVRIDASGVYVEGLLTGDVNNPDDPAGKVAMHARNGFQWKTSLGVKITRLEKVEAGESVTVNGRDFAGPGYICRAGEIDEVSFLSVAADKGATAKVAAKSGEGVQMKCFRSWMESRGINPDVLNDQHRETLKKDFDTLDRIQATGGTDTDAMVPLQLRAERQTRIRELAEQEIGVNPGAAGIVNATARQAIAEDWIPERFENVLLRSRGAGIHIDNRPRTSEAGMFTKPIIEGCGLQLLNQGHRIERLMGAQVAQQVRDLNIRGVLDFGERLLRAKGVNTSGLSKHDLVREMLRAGGGGPSTFDFSEAISSASQRSVRAEFDEAFQTYRPWCSIESVPNFKETKIISVAYNVPYAVIPPGGELQHGSGTEEYTSVSADTQGRMLSIDRRDLLNDDLGVLNRANSALARSAARAIADAVYRAMLGNAGDFFGAAHANYLDGAASVLSIDGIAAAVKKLRVQVDQNGNCLDLVPRYLLVGPSNEQNARAILSSTMLQRDVSSADSLPMGNPTPPLELLVEPRIENSGFTGYSTTKWWLLCAGGRSVPACVVIAFINGQEGPIVETVPTESNRLGLTIRGYCDFGVALSEYRTGVLNAGA